MISSDVIRGYNDTMILYMLLDGESYGYEISKNIRRLSEEKYIMKETTLYYGVVVLLAVVAVAVAVAVFLFVYYGNIRGAYQMLLKTGDFSKEKKEEDRIIGAVASIVWPLVTCVFLVSGFVYDQWHINWIVFPVTGILFGVFSSAYNILKRKDAA